MFTGSDSRLEFIKKSAYIVPAVLSLNVALVEARAGSPAGPCDGGGPPGQGGGGPPDCLPPGLGDEPPRGQRDTSRPLRTTR